jgi:hypothetical protein
MAHEKQMLVIDEESDIIRQMSLIKRGLCLKRHGIELPLPSWVRSPIPGIQVHR